MTTVLEILSLTKTFGGVNAVKDVSFNLKNGELLALIGPNGAGKSTILGLLAGVLKTTSGQIEVEGRLAPLLELGAGFLSVNDHSKFTLNIDLFKTFLKINNINFTFGPGANIIYKIYDDTSKKGGRLGLGFGLENTASSNFSKGHLFYFGRLYYPSYYIHTKNSTIGGSVGIMLQF